MEILRIQDVPENTKKAMKFLLIVFKGKEKLLMFDFHAVLGNVLGNHRFHLHKQPNRHVTLPQHR